MTSTAHTFAYLPANVHACWQASVRTYLLGVIGLVCLLPILVSSQPCPVTWGPTLQISNTPSSAFSPKLAVVGDTLHVVYHARSVFYRRSTDSGQTWGVQMEVVPAESMSASLGNRPLSASGRTVSLVWANRNASGAITSIKIRRSTDGGENWLTPQILVLNSSPPPTFTDPIVTAKENKVFIAVLGQAFGNYRNYIIRSFDGGQTWDSLRAITTVSDVFGVGDVCATGMAIHVVGEKVVQPSGREITYMVSTDTGQTWSSQQILSTIDNYRAWATNIASDDSGNVYVCYLDAKYGSIGGFAGTVLLRRSTDNGLSWLPEVRVTLLLAANGSSIALSGSIVHVGFGDERDGFQDATARYRASTNWGETWCDEMTLGGPLRRALGTSIGSTPDRVYAIWSSDRSIPFDTAQVFMRRGEIITSVVDDYKIIPETFGVSPLYPNPFNPITTLEYSIPSEGLVVISVFDNLGRMVRDLFEAPQTAGTYRIVLDGSQWASGVYYAVIRFNNKQIVRRVILMR